MIGPVSSTIAALRLELAGLLSPVTDPSLEPSIEVSPIRVAPAALGGYLGTDRTTSAERYARRLDAEVIVRVRAAGPEALAAAEARAALDLVGADPLLLRRRGLLRLVRRPATEAPLADPAARDIRFEVAFEHRPAPTSGEGTIETVRQGLAVTPLTGSLRLRYQSTFADDPMADFTQVDGSGTGGPGDWAWDEAEGEIRQTSTLGGGTGTPTANKQGAYLVLNPGAAGGPAGDFVLDAELRLDDPGATGAGSVGVVFRYRDPNNFGFALLDLAGWRMFALRSGGSGSLLQQDARDTTAGIAPGRWHRLRLIAEGDRFELFLDEAPALGGRDERLRQPGAVGFFCRRAAGARFGRLRLLGS
jgi:hypothetical protein